LHRVSQPLHQDGGYIGDLALLVFHYPQHPVTPRAACHEPRSMSRSGRGLRETPQRKSRVVEISLLGSERARAGNRPGYSTARWCGRTAAALAAAPYPVRDHDPGSIPAERRVEAQADRALPPNLVWLNFPPKTESPTEIAGVVRATPVDPREEVVG